MKIRRAQSTSKNHSNLIWCWSSVVFLRFNMDRSANTCWPYLWVLLLLYSGSVLVSLHTQTCKLKCLHLQSYHWISCKCGHVCLLGINDPSCMCPCHLSRWGVVRGPVDWYRALTKKACACCSLWVPSHATWDSQTRVCFLSPCGFFTNLKLNIPAITVCVIITSSS